MPRVVGQARVVDALDAGRDDERLGDGLRVPRVPLHPHRERLDATGGQVGVERRRDRTRAELQELHLRRELLVREHDGSADDVGVSAEVLRGRVHDDVGAERQRLLQVRRRERVVDDHQRARLVPEGRERGDVGDLHERVRRRLDPQHRGGRGPLQCRADLVEVAHVDDDELDAPRHVQPAHQAVGAAVHVVAHHDTATGDQRGAEQGVLGGEPGRERRRRDAPVEVGEEHLQRVARRVAGARVLVAVAHAADAVLHVRRRQVDRRDDGAGGLVGLLAGVDGPGAELGHARWFLTRRGR